MIEELEKRNALRKIAGDRPIARMPRATVMIGRQTVHAQFSAAPKTAPDTWSFHVNKNILLADFDVWVCGTGESYYLVPKDASREIYNAADGWSDSAHPDVKLVEIDRQSHICVYRAGQGIDFSAYYQASL